MGFDLDIPSGDDQLRKAFRTKVPGLMARFPALGKVFEVKDLSATGFAVLDLDRGFKEGQAVEVDLLIGKKLFLAAASSEVMRVLDNGIVGINFIDLERQKQVKLDKLVLEVQKRLIELRKKQRDQG
ncbi:MAG: PilZ domain-containing protein [Pseudodesulfovibrio sp.]|uniref:Type IV pilus assembly PilZ n=1 Tax=Pseudodesulfovibrio aespoeensis (strain ATCC 700646 / DSM 10631 / Aspo-2) TaxID=643562 RepID=E6VS44_PSEA9|nr:MULTISPECIES: PilZ domain-containing protein [Pseudodesulfovibrio]MBU4244037.1 PilZ domain-containing protein [Pseudomonadota bacterium]ADU63089.1 type IV pilus assembly PilZ [Pseudodesulfovibrio aespoeensis Aspo-2]MBU4380452.1 PilZ domain-containing protein [Pseudomonadota bacterium]MBU4474135.1 PilZ domain-containing protein [Pseudomonadota bacterium]MBU4516797.1 PilZ domain-containing protein [Pseudomonadota bacterium]